MKVFGNANALKKSIEKTYSDKVKEIDNGAKEEIKEINDQAKKEMDELVAKLQLATESEVNKTYSRKISEQTMEVKKRYEEQREACINEVFEEAEKQAAKIAHSAAYTKFVKKNMPKGRFTIVADGPYFKKAFPRAKVERGFHGIKFVSNEVTFDFTLNSAIASKRDALRHMVNEKLFG